MEMNKCGVSPVVAIVLILMLTVAAIAIVAGFVIPFIRNQLQKGTECIDYMDYFTFEESFELGGEKYKYNCYTSVGADILNGASVRTSSDESLMEGIKGFKLIFLGTGASKSVDIIDGEVVSGVKMLGIAGENLELPGAGELRTYVYTSSEVFQKMEIYPILKNDRVCEMNDEIRLIQCYGDVETQIKGA